jgi:hypothetical protein
VTNVIVIAAIITILKLVLPDLPAGLSMVLPVLVAAVAVVIGLLLWRALRRYLPWLYEAPRFTRI